MSLTIRPARRDEGPLVLALIRELAAYERLEHEVKADLPAIEAMLFTDHARAFCDIAELDGVPVGFAFWFYNLSTFEGRHGIYLEDLFVRPEARGRGVGLALMAHLARRCEAEGLARMDWAVLDWNTPARDFYDRLGAIEASAWITRRLSGAALKSLAAASLT